jgi:nucleotide-binding universal stress UspA family protein
MTGARNETRPDELLGRVLVGVDGSEESLAAVELVALLAPPSVDLVYVWSEDPPPVVVPRGSVLVHDLERVRLRAEQALEAAAARISGARTFAVEGFPWQTLLRELQAGRHTLVAVGGRRDSRTLGILAASVATELLHKAPCSVLVARPGRDRVARIVVGVDGSAAGERARAAAALLAARMQAELVEVTADEDPVGTLVEAATDADLLVVGSRGLSGLRSLGSVSERVAHQAPCSTLVVR